MGSEQPFPITAEIICELLADGEWWEAVRIVGHLRHLVPPDRATRLFAHWNHRNKDKEEAPVDVQVDKGRKYVVHRGLSDAKRRGYIEATQERGDFRRFRITKKGRRLIGVGKPNYVDSAGNLFCITKKGRRLAGRTNHVDSGD